MVKKLFNSNRKLLCGSTVILAAGMSLAACEPMTTSSGNNCSRQQACEAASYLASLAKADIGTDFGNGMVLAQVQVISDTVVIDMSVPETASELGIGLVPGIEDTLSELLYKGVEYGSCAPDAAGFTAQPYFETGARLRTRVITSDGVVAADVTIDSCV